jgi:hypothetical protein
MAATQPIDFLVGRNDLRTKKFEKSPIDPSNLAPGQALLKVDKFALTANNITYAVAGDMMNYWDFFPAAEGWGRVPVWGFADVVASNHDRVKTGARVYGYFPMSTHLLVEPDNVSKNSFTDISEHRREIHGGAYNNYQFVESDPVYSPADEDHIMLFRPLFITSFILDDFLTENKYWGAKDVVIISASSKTGYGLAQVMKQNNRDGVRVIGLTSKGNVGFVEGLGCYDKVVAYDDISSLTKQPAMLVDMSGDGSVLSAVHGHYGDDLKYSCGVGGTHWENLGGGVGGGELPGAKQEMFFAPGVIGKRLEDWGPAGFQSRANDAWIKFIPNGKKWVRVIPGRGQETVEKVYTEMLDGRVKPDQGYVLSLWDD